MKKIILIAFAFGLLTFQMSAAVNESFTEGEFKYTVLSEDGATGTVSIGQNEIPTGAICIPTSVTSDGITYSVTSIESEAFRDCNSLTSVVIPDSVTSIGTGAFIGCDGLVSVIIPGSVTSIGSSAFAMSRNLASVEIGNRVTLIDEWAFVNCVNLTSIVIPDSVNSIGKSAFSNCTNLEKVEIGSGVTCFGESAFSGCTNLKSAVIGRGVSEIGWYAFSDCNNLTSITIPDSVTSVGYCAFKGCNSLPSIIIPGSVTEIGGYAFSYCSNLASVTISEGVTMIHDGAFGGCGSLISILIPCSVTLIESTVFGGCSSLKEILVEETNENYSSLDGVLFNKNQSTLIWYPDSKEGEYIVPDSVTVIEYAAFAGSQGLTSVEIGKGVIEIREAGFYECKNLTSVYFKGNAPKLDSGFNFEVFGECPAAIYYLEGTTGWEEAKETWETQGLFYVWTLPGNKAELFVSQKSIQDGRLAMTLVFGGVLQSSSDLENWETVAEISPYVAKIAAKDSKFYRVKGIPSGE